MAFTGLGPLGFGTEQEHSLVRLGKDFFGGGGFWWAEAYPTGCGPCRRETPHPSPPHEGKCGDGLLYAGEIAE
jgi:hypothetical protein